MTKLRTDGGFFPSVQDVSNYAEIVGSTVNDPNLKKMLMDMVNLYREIMEEKEKLGLGTELKKSPRIMILLMKYSRLLMDLWQVQMDNLMSLVDDFSGEIAKDILTPDINKVYKKSQELGFELNVTPNYTRKFMQNIPPVLPYSGGMDLYSSVAPAKEWDPKKDGRLVTKKVKVKRRRPKNVLKRKNKTKKEIPQELTEVR